MRSLTTAFNQYAVENLGALNSSAVQFINTLGRRISFTSGEDKESAFFFNASLSPFNVSTVFCCSSLFPMTTTINSHSMLFLFLTFVFSPWDLYSLGHKNNNN